MTGRRTKPFMIVSLLVGIAGLMAAEAAPPRLTITKAEWNADKAELKVEGKAEEMTDVHLKDTTAANSLGLVRSNSKGVWKFKLSGLWKPPSRVTAEAGDLSVEKKVKDSFKSKRKRPGKGSPTGGKSHASLFASFEGTKTCLSCHEQEARAIHDSVHYQWKGDARYVIDSSTPEAGKLGGINDFCIYPDINWLAKLKNVNGALVDGGCAKCHAGLGEKPAEAANQAQLENVDCLLCHSESYRRTIEVVGGKSRFRPDESKMTVSIEEAATDISLPSKDRCLDCHAKSGGGDNYKRGDIEEAHRDATREFDVHLATEENGGAGLECLDCHVARDHKIAGRGTDLRPVDLDEKVTCVKCHSETVHQNESLDKHVARVNCTVCHIPFYAKAAPTDMERDWSRPGELNRATGLYEPHMVKSSQVKPVYRFFNGKSHFYEFGESASPSESGRVTMSAPDGRIQDPGAKIHAFKRHTAIQPIARGTGRLLPLKMGVFYTTGQVAPAVEAGSLAVGWPYSGHDFAKTERYMGLFHEVSPKEEALSCTDCHSKGGRLDFAALGYSRNVTYKGKDLCASCHKDKSGAWSDSDRFMNVHKKHVDGKKIDCSACHGFSAAS